VMNAQVDNLDESGFHTVLCDKIANDKIHESRQNVLITEKKTFLFTFKARIVIPHLTPIR